MGDAMSPRALLELDNLSTHYVSAQGSRVVRAVEGVSLRVNAGETLGIVGESGSGKTTLALSILRLLPPAARIAGGKLLFEGEDLLQKTDADMRHVRGKRIAMILQDPMASLNPLFTIGDRWRSRSGCMMGPDALPRGAGHAGCSSRCASRRRRRVCISIRTRCQAACASASWAPSASRALRGC
jgi:ABC-type oligopeptide transport system ATPase subunit